MWEFFFVNLIICIAFLYFMCYNINVVKRNRNIIREVLNMVTSNSVVKVPEWFFDKVEDESKKYHILLTGEYNEVKTESGVIPMRDHTRLRVDEVLKETEKAYQVALDAETIEGTGTQWRTWIPKSIILNN